jgi:nicotinic acid mononucleotide adenylyltransferase
MGFAVGAALLEKLFDEKFYQRLSGGLLEGLGLLLDNNTSLYVYPHKTDDLCQTLNTFSMNGPEQKIFDYFKQKNWIRELGNCEIAQLSIRSADIRKSLQEGKDVSSFVPAPILKYLSANNLYQPTP